MLLRSDTQSPFPLILSTESLPVNECLALQRNHNFTHSQSLRNYSSNPLDSEERAVFKLVDSGTKASTISDTLHASLTSLALSIHNEFCSGSNPLDPEFNPSQLNVIECWDSPGYALKPHIDSPKKIWTGVLYLFGDGHAVDGGTSFFRSTRSNATVGDLFYTSKPYPNSGVFFLNTSHSLHSVPLSAVSRHVLIYNYNSIHFQ